MSRRSPPPATATATATAPPLVVPKHWTAEQALAVAECLQAMLQTLWTAYGPQLQQAWRDQLMPDGPPPESDPDAPF